MVRPLSLRRQVKVGKRSMPEDLRALEGALEELGYYQPPKLGTGGAATRGLDDAIRRLQSRHNLKPDGIVKPHGPTAERMTALLVARRGAVPAPEARRPPSGAPSFINPNASTLLGDQLRELAGGPARGAKAPASANERQVVENRARSMEAGTSAPVSTEPKPRGRLIEEELKRARGSAPGAIPTLNMAENRIASIKQDTRARFDIADNPQADGGAPIYRVHSVGAATVANFDRIIERGARRQHVDPDLVRAIMYVENADGHYFGLGKFREGIGLVQTIEPMNVHQEIWAGIGGISPQELHRGEQNVRAAVIILARIIERLDDPTPAKVATIYNSTGKEKVSGYGERVRIALETRAWEKDY